MAKFRASLLDTLLSGARGANEEPDAASENWLPGVRLYSLDRMSESAFLDTLRRDLSWLLNTINLAETVDLTDAPEVAKSVVNFGIPDFAVRTYASVNVIDASASIASAIKTFEPRVDERSLSVRGEKSKRGETPALIFTIGCDVGPIGNAMRAGFRTEIDVETGDARLEQRR
jgi:type VI secretion system protein ImpF